MAEVIRKKLRARDIPRSWKVRLPGGPDAPVTVVITPTEPGVDDVGTGDQEASARSRRGEGPIRLAAVPAGA